MKIGSSVLSIGTSRQTKTVNSPGLFITAWWCAMAGLAFLPATFRAWSADCVTPPAGLVAWWPGQGNANDIAGTNNGTLSSGASFASGEVGQAFNFDGVNGYVEVASNSNLNPAAGFSIEGWIFPRQDRAQVIMSKWADSPAHPNQRSYCFQTFGNRALLFSISDWNHQLDGAFHNFFTTNNVIGLNRWSHVAAVYDQATGARRIYVNGVEVAERIDPPIKVANSTAEVVIGAALTYGPADSYFDGLIDELSFYSSALSTAEIQAIYNAGSAGKCVAQPPNCIPPPSGLVGWWPGQGNANDIAGTNNGTLSSGASFASGKVGQAFNFDGVNGYVEVANSSNLNPAASFTIEGWIYPRQDRLQVIMSKWTDSPAQRNQRSYVFITSANESLGFAVSDWAHQWDVSFHSFYTSNNAFVLNTWSHVAAVYDQPAGARRIYVNGVKVAERIDPPITVTNSTAKVAIGAAFSAGPADTYFDGLIDELSFYARALSAAEIQAIYNAGSSGKCVAQPPNCVPPPSGLVGWWPGEGNANDIAGTNNGTLQGGATFTTGMVGQAINLNGSSQYVDVPNSASLNPTASISLEAWIYPRLPLNSIGSPIIKKAGEGLGQQDGYSLEFLGTNGVVFCVNVNGTVWWLATDPAPVPFSQWSHVAGVYDGTNVSIYVNGLLVSRKLGAHPAPIVPSANHLQLGHDPSNPSRYFNGLIDEASIYRTALSSAQIQAIYAAGSAGKCVLQPPNCIPPPSGLVGWWPGQGNANDLTGANNGTLSGGVTFINGEVGQAFNFNPASGTVIVPDSPSLRLTNQLTIEAWINARSSDDVIGCAIVSKISINSGNNGYQLILVGNTLQGLLNSPGLSWPSQRIISGPIISTELWYHVAFTYDQSAMKLYCNGQPVATSAIGAHAIATSPSELRISGADEHGYFDGLIDEPSVYNRALSPGEIAAIYNAGSAGKCGSAITPLPRAATATATMVNDFVVGATITDGGWGYTNTPVVRISGGGGNGARAVAVVSNGVVIAVNILDAGYGYTSTPMVIIDPPFIANPVLDIAPMSFLVFSNLTLGGVYQMQQWMGWYWSNQPVHFTATNALYTQMVAGVVDSGDYRLALNPVPAQAFATAQVVNGFVVGATVTSGGSGYVTSPAVTIFGGGGANATAISHISGGVVISITIIDAGNGYTNTPTVRIAPPPAAAVSPTVQPVMRVDSANLVPYGNYQIQFKSDLGEASGNWHGGLFSPTDVTNSQYLFITNGVGFFRLQYVP
jgi:hypothetical protein